MIDFAYENDNNFTISTDYWSRILPITKLKVIKLCKELDALGVMIIMDGVWTIPSVEKRMVFIRSGSIGGLISKGSVKGKGKGNGKLNDNQRKGKYKYKGKYKILKEYKNLSETKKYYLEQWFDYRREIKKPITNPKTIKRWIRDFGDFTENEIRISLKKTMKQEYQGLFLKKEKSSDNKENSLAEQLKKEHNIN